MADSGEDSDLELSSSTLAALNEFRQEEAVRQQVQEDLLSGKAAIQVFSLSDYSTCHRFYENGTNQTR